MESLLHWCYPPQLVWAGRPLFSTKDLLIYLVLTGTIHTVQPFTGFDVVCPLPCKDPLPVFCAYVEAGLLCTNL